VEQARKILNMDDSTWNGLKAGVNVPSIFLGKKPL
jgi:hypothetical protein